MYNKFKLSVIIPTRNRAKVLEKALQSIVNQTLSQNHFEVIVVDNGSTDNTKSIADSFVEKIDNLIYIHGLILLIGMIFLTIAMMWIIKL